MTDYKKRVSLIERAWHWLFGSTEIRVGTIENDIAPPPPDAAEMGHTVLARAAGEARDA